MRWFKKSTEEEPSKETEERDKNIVTVYFVDNTEVTFEVYRWTTKYCGNFIQFISTNGKYKVFTSENVKGITWEEIN